MGAFMESFNNDLIASGQFVDAKGLDAPVHTRRLGIQNGVPYVTDGPYPEAQEVLAGYTIVECDGIDRATDIARRMSDCPPGPVGADGVFPDIRPIIEGLEDLDA